MALAAPGDLDPTFGGDGKVTTTFWKGSSATGVALQADGKLVVVGGDWGRNSRFVLARYNVDGTLDPTFSGDGKVRTDFTLRFDGAFTVAIQADGKIVAAGVSLRRFALARYNPDGTLDASFSGDGKMRTSFSRGFTRGSDRAFAVAIQADGKIVAAGDKNRADGKFALARYKRNGTLDSSFGGDGKVTTNFSTIRDDSASSVALQADGKIVAAGSAGASPAGFGRRFALVRYNPNGRLDSSFSGDGKVRTGFTPSDTSVGAGGVTLQADGKIVAAGTALGSGNDLDFALVRYNGNGTLDSAFGGDGKVTTDFTTGDDSASDVALQADGKIVAAGTASFSFALARYNPDGTLDTTFGGDGKVTTDFGAGSSASGVIIQADGKIVAAGSTPGRFAVARYLGG